MKRISCLILFGLLMAGVLDKNIAIMLVLIAALYITVIIARKIRK